MEGIKGLIESLKEFIWDVLGYLLPGLFVIVVLTVIIKSDYFLYCPLLTKQDNGINLIIIIIAYILGYVIYGIGEIKENCLGNKSFMIKILNEIESSLNYRMAVELLQKKLVTASITTEIGELSVSEVRSIAMSYLPDSDKKVYVFMFRSDLSRHIANSSLLIGVVGILIGFLQFFCSNIDIIRFDGVYRILYPILIAAFFALNATRDRFYKIAMSLPFSIFISFYNK